MLRRKLLSARLRGGFTIVEMLVCIAVLGLLLAILVPAVQQVRSTSRRMQCANNLRQIGLAMHSFQEEKKVFPGFRYNYDLLPYLEQRNAWELIENGSGMVLGASLEGVGSEDNYPGISFPVYSCPSDPAQSIARNRALNYRMNMRTGWGEPNGDGFLGLDGGGIRPADVRDGLSQTAALSERLLHRGFKEQGIPASGTFKPTQDQRLRRMATTDPFRGEGQLDEFAEACRKSPVWFGGPWNQVICTPFAFGCSGFNYNHILTPNQNSCYNGVPDPEGQSLKYSAQSASSLHSGGVNVLFGDGAVRFTSENVSESVWRALGTRSGGESNTQIF
ncbi:hypothetical protein Mal48_45800 [Thalassoglobus polymorphus]|uniref:DUF1559 domain-containing protein n=2 Tax=Thalassoglobus polymorphus TaxID=2527994 RepID=A0A517QUL4_9PLAN|nr:hypothetical protein Mal48_45800 [Thalassoglobus polymorphus]